MFEDGLLGSRATPSHMGKKQREGAVAPVYMTLQLCMLHPAPMCLPDAETHATGMKGERLAARGNGWAMSVGLTLRLRTATQCKVHMQIDYFHMGQTAAHIQGRKRHRHKTPD